MQYAEKHSNAYPTFCKFSKMIQNRAKLRNHLNFSAGAATQKRHKIVIKRRDKEDFLNPEMSQKTIPHWMYAADGNIPESKTLFISQPRWPKRRESSESGRKEFVSVVTHLTTNVSTASVCTEHEVQYLWQQTTPWPSPSEHRREEVKSQRNGNDQGEPRKC